MDEHVTAICGFGMSNEAYCTADGCDWSQIGNEPDLIVAAEKHEREKETAAA